MATKCEKHGGWLLCNAGNFTCSLVSLHKPCNLDGSRSVGPIGEQKRPLVRELENGVPDFQRHCGGDARTRLVPTYLPEEGAWATPKKENFRYDTGYIITGVGTPLSDEENSHDGTYP